MAKHRNWRWDFLPWFLGQRKGQKKVEFPTWFVLYSPTLQKSKQNLPMIAIESSQKNIVLSLLNPYTDVFFSLQWFTGWWFGTFLFSHILGIIIPIDEYFSEGLKTPTSWRLLFDLPKFPRYTFKRSPNRLEYRTMKTLKSTNTFKTSKIVWNLIYGLVYIVIIWSDLLLHVVRLTSAGAPSPARCRLSPHRAHGARRRPRRWGAGLGGGRWEKSIGKP